MAITWTKPGLGAHSRGRFDLRKSLACAWMCWSVVGFSISVFPAAAGEPRAPQAASYENDRKPEVPWSINIIRIPRQPGAFEIRTAHAQNGALGLATLSQQILGQKTAKGTPIAAVNGDFYQRDGNYAGDPRGLQIIDGELISGPAATASFWIDADGQPHTTNTISQFRITWPDGSAAPFGLNSIRTPGTIQVYTPAAGPSTRAAGGREVILEGKPGEPWLPLKPGLTYKGRVREVREGGDSKIQPGTVVVSIGQVMVKKTPALAAGAEVILSTETIPSLRGAVTAISGGPVLVQDGSIVRIRNTGDDSYRMSSMTERHPRTAVGWNDRTFFLVEVDGRQSNLSIGMTLAELADYFKSLGCREAMNLDGGGSSTLWYGGRVRNHPCDGSERMIANSLIVYKMPSATTNAPVAR